MEKDNSREESVGQVIIDNWAAQSGVRTGTAYSHYIVTAKEIDERQQQEFARRFSGGSDSSANSSSGFGGLFVLVAGGFLAIWINENVGWWLAAGIAAACVAVLFFLRWFFQTDAGQITLRVVGLTCLAVTVGSLGRWVVYPKFGWQGLGWMALIVSVPFVIWLIGRFFETPKGQRLLLIGRRTLGVLVFGFVAALLAGIGWQIVRAALAG